MKPVSARERLEQALIRIADPSGEGARACLTVYADVARKALKEPAVRQALERASLDVVGGTPQELAARIERDVKLWTEITTAIGLKKT